jgi:hypothetical protein
MFVSRILTANSPGVSTVAVTLAESSAEVTVATYAPASPAPVPTDSVRFVELPPPSVTEVESVPSDPTFRSIVCVSDTLPELVIVVVTFSVSPSRTGEFVLSMDTEKFAGADCVCTLTAVESESLSLPTAAV